MQGLLLAAHLGRFNNRGNPLRHALHLLSGTQLLSLLALLTFCTPAIVASAATQLSETEHTVGPGATLYVLRVDNNDVWTVSRSATWVRPSLTKAMGSQLLQIEIEPNPAAVDRTAILLIGGIVHTLTQKALGSALPELWAIGDDTFGQLGIDLTWPGMRTLPASISNDAVKMTAGSRHSLFIKTDGTLWGTGENSHGQLGDATTLDKFIPALLASGVSMMAAGTEHSLFVKTDGTLWAMGNNASGQLGDGTRAD